MTATLPTYAPTSVSRVFNLVRSLRTIRDSASSAEAIATASEAFDDFISVSSRHAKAARVISRAVEDAWPLADRMGTCDACDSALVPRYSQRHIDMEYICDTCADDYSRCDNCGTWTDELSECHFGDCCAECARYSGWCEECDCAYDTRESSHEDCGSEDDHDACYCAVERPTFRFPHGSTTVKNDHRIMVTLPSGIIDERGIDLITKTLIAWLFENHVDAYRAGSWSKFVADLSPEWTNKQGNFTKRLSKALWKLHNVKIDEATLGTIGSIAKDHTPSERTHYVEFNRTLLNTRDARVWVNPDSCWFYLHGEYTTSRCIFKSAGGLGIRLFEDMDSTKPIGRAWIIPLDANLKPTHDTVLAHSYLMFNAYTAGTDGSKQKEGGHFKIARILAQLTQKSYGKVIVNHAIEIYVNGDSGYLISDSETLADTNSVNVWDERTCGLEGE